ncbi:PIR Superfamily Protein [Plasmodium ovale curtisi]|uniref:PIR Superfamily Protein n=1 Tax=Plasmodium ovale curtisi TaxID=864141 RepID=A0A1A8WPI4_PLAOA|nr:PIR Superfamily Protein [Plasmodium ovale curtisi]
MDLFFQDWNTKYPSFIHSGLYKLYEIFFSNYYDTNASQYACNHFLRESIPEPNNLRRFCLMAELALQNVNKSIDTYGLDNIDKGCEYIRYLLYERIRNISNYINNIQNLYNALDAIKASNQINNSICKLENFDIDNEEFVKKKELYFHHEILQWIKKNHKTIYNYNSSYEKYLHDCATKYKIIVQTNDCKKYESYKQELKDFKDTFEYTKKLLLEQNKISSVDDLKLPDMPTCPSTRADIKLEKTSDGLHTAQTMNHGVTHSEDNESPTDDPSTDNGITGGIVSSITFGMIFLFFISYKFTPFGQKLHQLKGIPKKFFNKAEDESHELSLEREDSDYIELNNDMYNMQYHSIQNY